MSKKFSLLLAFVLLSVFTMHSQTVVKYLYDDAGNREYRGVIILQSQKQSELKKGTEYSEVKEELGKQKIVIYPNPTKGELIIELDGNNSDIEIEASIYSMKGEKLQNRTFTDSRVNMDLTGYPTGTYILKIKVGSTHGEWKIIKE